MYKLYIWNIANNEIQPEWILAKNYDLNFL